MKKNTQTESGIIREETVKGVEFSEDEDIIRVTHSDGTVTYRNPWGTEQETHEEDIVEILATPLYQLERLIDLFDEEDYERFGMLMGRLIDDANLAYEAIGYRIKEQIGDIRVAYTSRGSNPRGRILGARIIPKTPIAEEVKEV